MCQTVFVTHLSGIIFFCDLAYIDTQSFIYGRLFLFSNIVVATAPKHFIEKM